MDGRMSTSVVSECREHPHGCSYRLPSICTALSLATRQTQLNKRRDGGRNEKWADSNGVVGLDCAQRR